MTTQFTVTTDDPKLAAQIFTLAGSAVQNPAPVPSPVTSYPDLTMSEAAPFTPGVYPTTPPGEVKIGTGPHTLSIIAENGGASNGNPTVPFEFGVYITDTNGRHHVATLMHCTGWGWQDGGSPDGQRFTLSMDWATLQSVDIVSEGIGYPDYTAFFVSADGQSMYSNGIIGYGGGAGSANQTASFTLTAAPVAPPQVAGDGSLAKLIAATPTGGVLKIPAGTIKDSATVDRAMTITGAGMGQTIIDATGILLANGKGIFVPTVPGVTITDLTLTGASVPDNNGAGVRDDAIGIGFNLARVEIHHCQDGVLTFNGVYNFDSCNFHDNGAGDGQSHNIYIGAGAKQLTLTNSTSINPIGGHAVKSRALITTASGNTISATDGSLYDIPDGGVFSATKETWTKPAGSADHNTVTYALESVTNGVQGVTLNTVALDEPDGNALIGMGTTAPVSLTACTVKTGEALPTITWLKLAGTVTGAWT